MCFCVDTFVCLCCVHMYRVIQSIYIFCNSSFAPFHMFCKRHNTGQTLQNRRLKKREEKLCNFAQCNDQKVHVLCPTTPPPFTSISSKERSNQWIQSSFSPRRESKLRNRDRAGSLMWSSAGIADVERGSDGAL